jgi:transposase-like protein
MSTLQRAAQAAIKTHKSVRKAAKALGMDHTALYRISRGERKTVSAATAAKFGLAPAQTWRRL